jgi:anhydro-N-acetylmuramic acid kinase
MAFIREKFICHAGLDKLNLCAMAEVLALGIMSGTSIDSVDYALCKASDRAIRLQAHWQVNFPRALQRRLHAAAQGKALSHEVAQLHHDLGRFYAEHAMPRGRTMRVAVVGLHGQTIFHNPKKNNPATFQLGEPAWLAERLHAPVVSNFRAADIAVGGQGAPLATMFHVHVFAERGRHVCFNNLGGISNVTSIDWADRRAKPKVMAFDTGPANILINLAMRTFTKGKLEMDKNGRWAQRGELHEDLINRWLADPFFRQKPPKSTGRELFGEEYLQKLIQETRISPADFIACLTEFTARSIRENYRLHLHTSPSKVILGGGGAANPVLRTSIERNLIDVEVRTSEDLGWPLQAIEPAAFALLAYKRLKGQLGNLPETTGSKRAVLLGQLTEPSTS